MMRIIIICYFLIVSVTDIIIRPFLNYKLCISYGLTLPRYLICERTVHTEHFHVYSYSVPLGSATAPLAGAAQPPSR